MKERMKLKSQCINQIRISGNDRCLPLDWHGSGPSQGSPEPNRLVEDRPPSDFDFDFWEKRNWEAALGESKRSH
jgi:hypothetical protein